MTESIDVVIPVRDNYELTDSCLRHLSAQTVPHSVTVVDDGSSDDTPALVRRDWPNAALIELGANRGYTHAVNRGVREGAGEYIVLLNNDVELRPDCLERLLAPMRSERSLGSTASLMLAPDGSTIDSVGVAVDVTLAGFARLQGRPATDAGNQRPVLAGPEGTAGAYRRSAWEQVGGFDELIPAYMEVVDIALRLRSAGWATAAATDAVGVHLGSVTYGRRSARQRNLAGFSRGYLLRRYGVLRKAALRSVTTEAGVVIVDALLCRDLQALRGRLEGWRAGGGLPRHPWPPAEAIDSSISFTRSLQLRRAAI